MIFDTERDDLAEAYTTGHLMALFRLLGMEPNNAIGNNFTFSIGDRFRYQLTVRRTTTPDDRIERLMRAFEWMDKERGIIDTPQRYRDLAELFQHAWNLTVLPGQDPENYRS